MITTFQLDSVNRTAFDAHLARTGMGTLTRAATATFLASDCGADEVRSQLALAGIRAAIISVIPAPARGMRPAICFELIPLQDRTDVIDTVEFRPVALRDASAALMRERQLLWRSSRTARDACRRLLHDEDAVVAWRRVVWAPVASLRAIRGTVRSRPVVFDRVAIERQPWRWAYASQRALERWAFA